MAKTVIAVAGDLHAGSTVALCPPEVPLDDGGFYHPSKAQSWLWQCWLAYWQEVEREAAEADRFYQIFNGDMLDGDHHNTSQIISRNPADWSYLLGEALAVPLALRPDKLFVVRGTEVHNGKSNSGEEGLAKRWRLDGLPIVGDPETGTASWWHLRAEIDGVRLDVAHHGRTGHREHTRTNAANLHAHDILLAHVKQGDTPPDLCLRAHYHRFNDSYDACPVRVITNGAWQLKTGFVHRIAADTLADIGGMIITIEDGAYSVRKIHHKPERGPVWKAA
jgi:hypothetical protein